MKTVQRNRKRVEIEFTSPELGALLCLLIMCEPTATGDLEEFVYKLWDQIRKTPDGARQIGLIKEQTNKTL